MGRREVDESAEAVTDATVGECLTLGGHDGNPCSKCGNTWPRRPPAIPKPKCCGGRWNGCSIVHTDDCEARNEKPSSDTPREPFGLAAVHVGERWRYAVCEPQKAVEAVVRDVRDDGHVVLREYGARGDTITVDVGRLLTRWVKVGAEGV